MYCFCTQRPSRQYGFIWYILYQNFDSLLLTLIRAHRYNSFIRPTPLYTIHPIHNTPFIPLFYTIHPAHTTIHHSSHPQYTIHPTLLYHLSGPHHYTPFIPLFYTIHPAHTTIHHSSHPLCIIHSIHYTPFIPFTKHHLSHTTIHH